MSDGDGGDTFQGGLVDLYGKIQKAVEVSIVNGGSRSVVIMIDDISLLEVAAKGSSNHVLDFLHYCHTLKTDFVRHSCVDQLLCFPLFIYFSTSNCLIDPCLYINFTLFFSQGCSLAFLNHEDIYSSTERSNLILQMEYLADVVIKAEPLATGLAKDVHGQVLLCCNDTLIVCFGVCAINLIILLYMRLTVEVINFEGKKLVFIVKFKFNFNIYSLIYVVWQRTRLDTCTQYHNEW